MDHHIIIFLCTVAMLRPGNSLLPTNKLSQASWGSYNQREHKGFGTYSYGYKIEDPVTGNIQFKQEERHLNGTVTGSYGYIDANGQPQVTHYISDTNGYRVVKGEQRIPEILPMLIPAQQNDILTLPIHELFYPTDNNKHLSMNQMKMNILQSNRVQNPPPILYQFQGSAPFLTFYNSDIQPIPILFKRK